MTRNVVYRWIEHLFNQFDVLQSSIYLFCRIEPCKGRISMTTLSLPSIPGDLQWKNDPVDWKVGQDNSLSIAAGAKTDWFVEPSGSTWVSINAPAALFTPPDENFLLSTNVTVNFAST